MYMFNVKKITPDKHLSLVEEVKKNNDGRHFFSLCTVVV